MAREVLYVGIDVDDKNYNIATFNPESGETKSVKCGASAEYLRRKLINLAENKYEIRSCYESTYIGFSLARKIADWGFGCEVIASSLIPQNQSDRVKTDRLDALKLARLYSAGMLTTVAKPSVEKESHRRLLRSRKFLVHQASKTKLHLMSSLRTLGLNYKEETLKKQYWSESFKTWLREKIALLDPSAKFGIEMMLSQLQSLENQISLFDQQIKILSETQEYKEKVEALSVYRSIDTNAAMTIITEVFDIKRFQHPKKLMSYAGLNISEYSSGGNERKFTITKMGSKHLRTAVVEASQYALRPVAISRSLAKRRAESKQEYIDIANRGMARLHKKGTRLLFKGKPQNKIKTALARELLGFIWESLSKENLNKGGVTKPMNG